ncbi:MAG: hypothetical protein P8J74_04350 [Woeseiaceae bacterium]|nr:hypothetical protein [Woeseiaceae bacterium]
MPVDSPSDKRTLIKMDDAALTIRQYVAALLPTISGFFLDGKESETGGCDGCRVELMLI